MFKKSYNNLNLTKLTLVLVCLYGSSSIGSADTKIDIGAALIGKSGVIEANSEKLKIDSNSGTATFSGNVEIKRGQISLKAQEIIVSYSLNKDSTQSITEILATKNVSFFSRLFILSNSVDLIALLIMLSIFASVFVFIISLILSPTIIESLSE